MNATGARGPRPQTITTPGVLIPAEDVAQVAGWLMLLRDYLTGVRPPGGARQPQLSRALLAYIDTLSEAAREHEAAEHRAAVGLGQPKVFVVGPAQIAGSWEPSETITTAEAGILLDVSAERARQHVASGRIRGYRDKRGTWQLYRDAVIAYRDNPRGTDDGDGQARADRPGDAAIDGTGGGRPAA